ncbi:MULTISPECIES: ThuA domain-containing protein [unclassified Saccharicrinis]|uniref:ThuA domain-containing protein n=1 Tax=unclassified Saccharicrinis TaxID=2646859 RepID=UPI003D33186A
MKNTLKWITVLIFVHSSTFIMSQNQFKLLLFTQEDEWHSDCIPVAIETFQKMSIKHQFHFDWTLQPEELAEKLYAYDVLVFLNANVDSFDSIQIQALKSFINNDGGFVGIHACSYRKKNKPWFDGLIGGVFSNHPKLQTAIVKVEEKDFPAVMHLSNKWLWSDEWYNFRNLKDDIRVVLSVDENSYNFTAGYDNISLKGMGANHPISWYHHYDGGRVFYTSLGHKPEAFKNDLFLNHIFGGIYWALGK